MKEPITYQELYELYVIQGLSTLNIARTLHRKNEKVVQALHDFGFYTKVTKEWLEEHYIKNEEDIEQICQQLQCKEANVRKYLRNFSIPIRYKKRGITRVTLLDNPEWLYEHYVTKNLAASEISDILGCNQSSVVRALINFSINRTHYEPRKRGKQNRYFRPNQRTEIFTRDGYICKLCGISKSLEVHHIIPVSKEGTNSINNGITLCSLCYDKITNKEQEYEDLFKKLILEHSA